ncbi:hypothetical protein ACJO2E_05005 [Marinobacter sp. M1N3S26]|uniref:hypothetical protein n=1 Tax=unclassified Marinobacter TaxID=83889 RepID=UPI00387B4E32
MTTVDREFRPRDSWMPAIAMLTVALLGVAALLNGVGPVGVMSGSHSGGGHYVALPALAAEEQVVFAGVDQAIERLHLTDMERPEQFEAYESLLLAVAESLPVSPGEAALTRVSELLDRSLPAPAARDVADVLPSFLAYLRAEESLLGLTPGAPRTVEGAYLHLQLQDALRRIFLGDDLTTRLYSTSYHMIDTHLVRQILMERTDLEESEKQRLIREQMEALSVGRNPGDAG